MRIATRQAKLFLLIVKFFVKKQKQQTGFRLFDDNFAVVNPALCMQPHQVNPFTEMTHINRHAGGNRGICC